MRLRAELQLSAGFERERRTQRKCAHSGDGRVDTVVADRGAGPVTVVNEPFELDTDRPGRAGLEADASQ